MALAVAVTMMASQGNIASCPFFIVTINNITFLLSPETDGTQGGLHSLRWEEEGAFCWTLSPLHKAVQVLLGPRRGCWVPLELEIQAAVSCLVSVLGTELRTSGRAARALNH